VAFGTSALLTNTTGIQNTAVGTSALDANTTASNNTAVGYAALGASTTGIQNTAVGTSALSASTTGDYNAAVGQSALLDVTTGTLNVGVGYLSGSGALTAGKLTTGTGNVFIGYRACGTVAAQNYGTALGYDVEGAAGYTTVGQSTSDIRAAHGVATWATVSDQRYKKDIVDSTAGLDFVNALRPRTFKYRTLGELPETFRAYAAGSTEVFKNSNTNHGFIAQEVKAAIDADSSIKDGFRLWDDREDGSQEVAEAALIPILTKAIQELSAKVNSLTTRLEALEEQ
jgi:trimeric autotransporter adhesin